MEQSPDLKVSKVEGKPGLILYPVLLVALLLWAPLVEGGSTYLAWTVSRLIVLAAFLIAMWRSLCRGEIELPRSYLMICWYVLAIILLIEAINARYSYIASQWTISYATIAAAFFLAAHVARTGRSLWIERALLISGVSEACWGISQYLWDGLFRAKGSFFNPSYFGGYLAALAAIPLARSLFSSRKDFKILSVALYILTFLLLVAGVLVSGSRGAIAALIVGLAVVGGARLGAKIVPIILLAFIAILIIPNPFSKRLKELGQKDVYAWSRIAIWRSSVSMIKEHPFGVGPGMYRYYSQKYAFPVPKAYAQYGKVAERGHSSVFDLACELSPAGALLIFGMAFYVLGLGMWAAFRNKTIDAAAWSGAFAAVMAQAVFDSLQTSPPNAFFGAVSGGIIWASKLRDMQFLRYKVNAKFRWFILVLGVLLLFKIVAPTAAFYASEKASRSGIENAEKWLKIAVMLAPNNAAYWYNRGTREKALWENGQGAGHLKSALEYMEFAQELNPLEDKYFSAYANLLASVSINDESGKDVLVRAIEYYKRAHELAPKNPFYPERIGEIFVKLGKPKDAIEAFREAVEIEPNYLGARRKLAQELNESGNVKDAAEQYRILLEKIGEIPKQMPADYERELGRLDIEAVKSEAAKIGAILQPRPFSGN